ncbi:MAG: PAS domain S-box protein [Symploca sp. SIO2C1]|nr:PAS domain S-box protein [Symploca sp. SIO2C1]
MDSSQTSLTWFRQPTALSVRWRGTLIISIPVICLLALILAIAGLRSQTRERRVEAQQSRQTIIEANRLMKGLLNAETSVRGYLITRREEFLEPYLQAKELLPKSLNSLSVQVQANSLQHQQLREISTLAQEQIKLLEEILQASKATPSTQVTSSSLIEQLQKSQLLMDDLRGKIEEFFEKEERAGRDHEAQVIYWQELTNALQWFALAVGLVGLVAALYLFNKLDRELAQQASNLRESNLYMQAVFDNVVDGILILNEQGYIQFANAASVQIFGYQPDELKNMHLQILFAQPLTNDSGQTMNFIVGKNQDKLKRQQETIGNHKEGKTFPMEFAISKMQLDNEPHSSKTLPHKESWVTIETNSSMKTEQSLFIAIVRDISDRKQSQETLLKQAQLLDLANDTIMVRDLNDKITYWNQGAQRLYGWTAEEAVGNSARALLKTELPLASKAIRHVLFQDGYWNGELVHSRRDGTRVPVASGWTLQRDEKGQPIAYLEINQDITQRKQAEAALRRSEKLYRTLAQNFPNGAVFLFDHDLRYNIAQGSGLAQLNLESNALTGKTISEAWPPETAQSLEPIYSAALTGKATVTEIQFADRIYCVHVLPVTNEYQEVFCGMSMTQDITQSKRNEVALQSRAQELAQMTKALEETTTILEKKNSELDQFAYIVSHDLKAPLRAIANLSQWIEEDLQDHLTEETRHQMDLLRGRVQRMEALINGLLQYSRAGRLQSELELVDVEELLKLVIDSLAPVPTFTIDVMPGMPKFITERLPLTQVFANLISNGIKHNHRSDGKIVILVTETIDFYEFSIADNGPGIAAEFHEKIFVMFQTLEPRDQVENTGVGLAIVKKIIEDKGGKISLESQRSQGATFRFTWPKQSIEQAA